MVCCRSILGELYSTDPFSTGFVHNNLDIAPSVSFSNPTYSSSSDIDYAGNNPATIARVGTTTDGSQGKQIAISSDGGVTWYASHIVGPEVFVC